MLAFLAVMDAAAWSLVTGALRAGVDDWASRQRHLGVDVLVTDGRAGGWPFAATWGYAVRLGPGGLPGGARVEAALTSAISPLRPGVVITDVAGASIVAANGAVFAASATRWTAELALAAPDRVRIEAAGLRVAWGGRHIDVATLAGVGVAGVGGQSVDVALGGIDLAGGGGVLLPPPFGSVIRAVTLDAVLHGAVPPVAATAEASARAWRDEAGQLEVKRLAIAYGPLDASIAGRFGLDKELRPAGEATLIARGLTPLLEASAESGLIPARAGQAAGGVLALLGGETPRIPVTVADGQVSVMRFPIARLPRMAWQPQ